MLVTVENGKAIEIRGDPAHPPTAGKLCTKVARYLDRTYSTARVLHPMRRVERKRQARFARIGWDEALDEIAAQFKAIAASSDGPEAIVPYSYCGTMGLVQSASMDRRFFHRLGASLLDRTICATAGKVGWNSVIGASVGSPVEVSGTADVFEATVSLRILDADGNEIASGCTTATCGPGCRGTYRTTLAFHVDHDQSGTAEVFEASAENGQPINVVDIPVTLQA